MINLRNTWIALFYTYSCCLLVAQEFNKHNYASNSMPLTALSFSDSTVKKKQASKAQTMGFGWERVKQQISPMVGFKWGGTVINDGDSSNVFSVELGAGLTRGYINVWDTAFGGISSGSDWEQLTLPYLSLEYKLFNRYRINQPVVFDPQSIQPFMVNIGISGAKGGMVFLIPAPLALEGMAGLSTDFKDLYVRGRIGWNIVWFSVNVGGYYSLTQSKTRLNNPNYMFFEFSFNIWRSNKMK